MAQPRVRSVEPKYLKLIKMPAIHIVMEISVHLAISKSMGFKMNVSQAEFVKPFTPNSNRWQEKLQDITGFLLFCTHQ